MTRLGLGQHFRGEETGERTLTRSLTRGTTGAEHADNVGGEALTMTRGPGANTRGGHGAGGRHPVTKLPGVNTLGQQTGRQLLLGHGVGLT